MNKNSQKLAQKVQVSIDKYFKKTPSNKYAPKPSPKTTQHDLAEASTAGTLARASKSPSGTVQKRPSSRQLSPLSQGTTLAPPSTDSLADHFNDERPTSKGLRKEADTYFGGSAPYSSLGMGMLEPREEYVPATQQQQQGHSPLAEVGNTIESQFLFGDDVFDDPHAIGLIDDGFLGAEEEELFIIGEPTSTLPPTLRSSNGASSSATLLETSGSLLADVIAADIMNLNFPQRFLSGSGHVDPVHGQPRFVYLPWSSKHRYQAPNGRLCSHWDRAITILSEAAPTITTANDLAELIRSVQPDLYVANALELRTLVATLDTYVTASFKTQFMETTLPWMVKVLEGAPSCLPQTTEGLQILRQGEERAVKLSQAQAATLLVCGFFSLMPYRYHPSGLKYKKGQARSPYTGNGPENTFASMPSFNFNFLFGAFYRDHENRPQTPCYAKIACLLNYFNRMAETWPTVVKNGLNIEFVRCVKTQENIRTSLAASASNPLPQLMLEPDLLIEDAHGQLQADFANQYLGGGVLGKGCVQEEIRMVVCPELLVGLLLCEPLKGREAIVMSGCAQYSLYSGYARGFTFAGSATLPPLNEAERTLKMRNVAVVAFDALNFHAGGLSPPLQFQPRFIDAEITKAFVAFSGSELSTILSHHGGASSSVPIATGHWGCGAFGGDRELKFLIQLCAAGFANRRPVTYCTFGDNEFADRCTAIYKHLTTNSITVGTLYKVISQFAAHRTQYRVSSIFDYLLC